MDPFSIFWFILILASLQPLLAQKVLEARRQALISRLERERKSRVILLVHRQERMSFLGIPVVNFIDIEDSEKVIRVIHNTPKNTAIDLVLHTPGGLVLAAVQIAEALANHPGETRVIVPHYAMSGGTLIALAAKQIYMSPAATLGPLDPQLGQYPAPSLLKVKSEKDINKIDDATLVLADQAEKALQQIRTHIQRIMRTHYSEKTAAHVAEVLTEGRWTHDYPIMYEEAQQLGLNVSTEIPEGFVDLMDLYPQPVKRIPTVEYLPHHPRHRNGSSD